MAQLLLPIRGQKRTILGLPSLQYFADLGLLDGNNKLPHPEKIPFLVDTGAIITILRQSSLPADFALPKSLGKYSTLSGNKQYGPYPVYRLRFFALYRGKMRELPLPVMLVPDSDYAYNLLGVCDLLTDASQVRFILSLQESAYESVNFVEK